MKRWPLALILVAMALTACAPKPEAASLLVGDWTSPALDMVYDAPWVRILNRGKPLEGAYWHIDASGEIAVMKDGVKLSDHLKRIGQENQRLNMAALRDIGNAFPRISWRVEENVWLLERKYKDQAPETDRFSFAFSADNNTMTLTDLRTGEVSVFTRLRPPVK